MKKLVKLSLLGFVLFTLSFSILSIEEAKGAKVQECVLSTGRIYYLSYFVRECTCHGEMAIENECRQYLDNWCICHPSFCEDE
jgi:hypothetical protein